MKPDATSVDLTKVNVEQIDMPHHRSELRNTLLNSPHWQKTDRQLFSEAEGMGRKRILVAAAIAVSITAIVLVFGIVVMASSTNTAYAADLAQRSYQAIIMLPPDQQGELVHKLQASDPKALLLDAKNAKDLKAVSYEQFISEHPMPTDATPSHREGPDLSSLTFLQFTDTDGGEVVLGIDKNTNLPAIVWRGWSQGSNVVPTEGGLMRFYVTPSQGTPSQGSNSVPTDGNSSSGASK